MAYVSISRVRSLRGLRFARSCKRDLDCLGCAQCTCELTPADARAHGDVRTFYRLAAELRAAVDCLAARLERAGEMGEEGDDAEEGLALGLGLGLGLGQGCAADAEQLRALGPRGAHELCSALAQRIDVPLALRQQAAGVAARAAALNPGERGEASRGRGRKGTGVEGWWTLPPKCEGRQSRAL